MCMLIWSLGLVWLEALQLASEHVMLPNNEIEEFYKASMCLEVSDVLCWR